MLNHDIFIDIDEHKKELEFNNLIEACHRTIDWSVRLYIKSIKKAIPLISDKLIKDEKSNIHNGFRTYLLNDTDIVELISEIEEHINQEIISIQNKWLPDIKFQNLNTLHSLEFLSEMVKEQKTTIKLSKQVDKTISQLTTNTLMNLTPAFVPRSWITKTHPTLGNKITKAFVVDIDQQCSDSKATLEKQLLGLLEGMEHDIKENLKFQLAEQLYNWYDQYVIEPEQQVVNQ